MLANSTLATGSNVITLKMLQNPGGCGPAMVAPEWSYASPTPAMEASGLTPSRLREILQQINDDSAKTMTQNFNPILSKLRFLPFILVIVGSIICFTAMGSFDGSGSFLTGMAIMSIGGFGGIGACWFVYSRWNQATQICVNNMKQYVEGRLNEDWKNSNSIRWSVETTQVLETHGSGHNQRLRTRTLFHIQVTAANPAVAMTQQVPIQHTTVQMPLTQGMQGIPVNMQGQQMVMVPAGTQIPMQMQHGQVQYIVAAPVQSAPPQYQEQAPPQYEAGGAVTGNADAEGGPVVYS